MNKFFIVASLVSMLLGLFLTFMGIAYYEKGIRTDEKTPWWVWTLIAVGVTLTIFGVFATVILMGRDSDPNEIPGLSD